MSHSKVTIYVALGANFLIAVVKFIAAGFSGSSAMLSEGIHSVADTCNQLLLLLGVSKSKKPADEDHPFGYGKEIYFWTLIVAILLFGIGGGMSVYEGIVHVRNPEPISDPTLSFIVLGAAFLFEGTSLAIGIRKFLKQLHSEGSFWKKFQLSVDPSYFVIIYEDGAALIGLLIAAAGIFLSNYFQNPIIDGIASILIGIELALVAVMLILKSRKLLIGASAKKYLVQGIHNIVKDDEDVSLVKTPLTMQMSPENVLLALDVEFKNNLDGRKIVAAISRLENQIKDKFPEVNRIYVEAGKLSEQKNQSQQQQ